MSSMMRSGSAMQDVAEPFQAMRVLVMPGDGTAFATCRELSRLPGCSVQTCSSYLELLLRLEHEDFQLVIIFEGEDSPPLEWHDAVQQAAETNKATPVVVIKRFAEASRFLEALAN
jgi:hypothetical protein